MQTRSQTKSLLQAKSTSKPTCARPTSPVTRSQTSRSSSTCSTKKITNKYACASGITTRSGLVLSAC